MFRMVNVVRRVVRVEVLGPVILDDVVEVEHGRSEVEVDGIRSLDVQVQLSAEAGRADVHDPPVDVAAPRFHERFPG